MPLLSEEALRRAARAVIAALGTPEEAARFVADSLVEANLAGHDSHGVLRLPWYADQARAGRIHPSATPFVAARNGATARVDGAHGWGQLAADLAARTTIDLAGEYGVGAVVIVHGNHIGRVGAYVEQIAAAGMIGIAFCNASPSVAPFGGFRRLMGTNPFAWAAPGGPGAPPLVLDFATSSVAEGKLRVARAKGEPVPLGTIVTAEGGPTTDPATFYEGGALLPFGVHKGSGMSVMIELLARGLAGVDHSQPQPDGFNGTLILALDIGALAGDEDYSTAAARLAGQVSGTEPAEGVERVLLPGEPERLTRRERQSAGIPLPEQTWEELRALAAGLGVPPDLFAA